MLQGGTAQARSKFGLFERISDGVGRGLALGSGGGKGETGFEEGPVRGGTSTGNGIPFRDWRNKRGGSKLLNRNHGSGTESSPSSKLNEASGKRGVKAVMERERWHVPSNLRGGELGLSHEGKIRARGSSTSEKTSQNNTQAQEEKPKAEGIGRNVDIRFPKKKRVTGR